MSEPSSSLLVTNTGSIPVYAAGVQIGVGGNSTFTGANITAVCGDMNFWGAFLAGNCSVAINGQALTLSPAVVAFLIEIAVGNITPTA